MIRVSSKHMRLIRKGSLSLLSVLMIAMLIACTDAASTTPSVSESPIPSVSASAIVATSTPTIPALASSPPASVSPVVVSTPTPFSPTAVPVEPMTPTPCELTVDPDQLPTPIAANTTISSTVIEIPTPSPLRRNRGASGNPPFSSCRPNPDGYTGYAGDIPHGTHYLTSFSKDFVEWTDDGSRIVFGYDGAVWSVDSTGSEPQIVADANPGYRPYGYPALPFGLHGDVSSKGCRIVYSTCQFAAERRSFSMYSFELIKIPYYDDRKSHYEIATVRIDGGDLQRLTDNEWIDHFPTWSPDGTRIAFISEKKELGGCRGDRHLYAMNADGSDIQLLTPIHMNVALSAPQWSPNGRRLAFIVNEDSGENDCMVGVPALYTVMADGSGLTHISGSDRLGEILVQDWVPLATPSWSPDGNRIAFVGKEGRGSGIYTVRFDGTGLERLPNHVTFRAAKKLAWSPDGTDILYSSHGVWVAKADGSGVSRLSNMSGEVAWSPDGSRIALYIPHSLTETEAEERGEHPYAEGDFGNLGQLFTMDRDGSDVKVLFE